MRTLARYHVIRLLALGILVFAFCGCRPTSRTEFDILPGTDKARAALEKALTAWKDGQKIGKIQEDSHSIEVVDRVWQKGSKLASFEILQPEDKPGPRWFSVKLTLKDSRPQQVHYAVVGLDPLWVYREEDYNQACGLGQ